MQGSGAPGGEIVRVGERLDTDACVEAAQIAGEAEPAAPSAQHHPAREPRESEGAHRIANA